MMRMPSLIGSVLLVLSCNGGAAGTATGAGDGSVFDGGGVGGGPGNRGGGEGIGVRGGNVGDRGGVGSGGSGGSAGSAGMPDRGGSGGAAPAADGGITSPIPTTTTFNLSSATGGAQLPFTIGLAFRRGELPAEANPALDLPDAQVEVKRRWNDGSVKHAVASGLVDLIAAQPKTVKVVVAAPTLSAKLTCSDIAAAAPQASVAAGALGTVELGSLLAAPVRTWLTGPAAVECHYRGKVGTDTTLRVQFQVRLYRGGRLFVRAAAENGYLDVNTAPKSYAPTVKIGGKVVFGGPTAPALNHHAHTRWFTQDWIGGDPQVVPQHDVRALVGSLLVPNYKQRPAAAAALTGLYQTYQPMEHGGWTADMGATGFQGQIGLLPNWDALYVTSNGDGRAFKSVQANAQALNSYPLVWRDSADDQVARPSSRPTWTINGKDGGGETRVGAGALAWDNAHHGSGGYLAYLLTGDFVFLETMAMQSSLAYLIITSTAGAGKARILTGQTRAMAWANRTVGQYAAVAPLDATAEDFRALLAANATHWRNVTAGLSGKRLGLVYSYELGSSGYGPGVLSPWQENFVTQVFGHVSDIEPLGDMTDWNSVRDYAYQFPVGLLGVGGADGYCFTKASQYTLKVADVASNNLQPTYASWGTVYAKMFNGAACGDVLEGGSGGAPEAAAMGYWGNLMPAIAYAVDHHAPGAAAAWSRMTAARNYAAVQNSSWDTAAAWGVVPR